MNEVQIFVYNFALNTDSNREINEMLQSKFELISQNVSLRAPISTAPLTISMSAVRSLRPKTMRSVREDSFWINLIKECLIMFADVGGSQS